MMVLLGNCDGVYYAGIVAASLPLTLTLTEFIGLVLVSQ